MAEVWPENWPSWVFFCEIATQWRVGPSGAYGLDYNVVYRELDELEISGDERRRMRDDIREIEYAALQAMRADD